MSDQNGLSNNVIRFPLVTGITASTTQTEGNGQLTSAMSVVSTVANDNDTVTMPAVAKGVQCVVANTSSKVLKVYAGSSGSFDGQAVSVPVYIPAGRSMNFWLVSTGPPRWMSDAVFGLTLDEPPANSSVGLRSIFDIIQAGELVNFGDMLYLKSDGKWWKTDADTAAKMPGLRMATATIQADAWGQALVKGRVWHTAFPTLTVGGAVYPITGTGGAAGEVTPTAPSGTGDQVQILGYAYHAAKMIFDPSPVLVEIT